MNDFLLQIIDQINSVNYENSGIILEFREKKCKEYLKNINPNWLIRSNPSCPHKSHINLIGLIMLYDHVKSFIHIVDFHPEKFLFDCENTFYRKKMFQVTINEHYEIPQCHDIFEGIEFEDANMNGVSVEFVTNGFRNKFVIKNNRLFKNGDYIPVKSCMYTRFSLFFPKTSTFEGINCKMIFGNFNISHSNIFHNNRIIMLDNTSYILSNNMFYKELDN